MVLFCIVYLLSMCTNQWKVLPVNWRRLKDMHMIEIISAGTISCVSISVFTSIVNVWSVLFKWPWQGC